MKLNYDLIRDILLSVEDISDGWVNFPVEYLQETYLQCYELKVILYHVKQLSQGGIIQTSRGSSNYIIDLTWYGHQYLANIRDTTIWTKTKERIKPLGNVALDIILDVSKALIKSSLKLEP